MAVITIKVKLSLQEKLRDLRAERKQTLSFVSEQTQIPISTIQRLEDKENTRVGYQDIVRLAHYYEVTTDYLFGLTDNRQYRNYDLEDLHLTDAAISVLKDKKYNNRLLSDMIAHPDFGALLNAIEVYIDGAVQSHISTANQLYQLAQNTITGNYEVTEPDPVLNTLKYLHVDETAYMDTMAMEQFRRLLKSLSGQADNQLQSMPQEGGVNDMVRTIQNYLSLETPEERERERVKILASQLGMNPSQLSDEQVSVLTGIANPAEASKRRV